jgi:hypothetical protein
MPDCYRRGQVTNPGNFTYFSPIMRVCGAHSLIPILSIPSFTGISRFGKMPSKYAELRLDYTHCRAIFDEIGERLRELMRRDPVEMSPYLRKLVDRLVELDHVSAHSIVPSADDIQGSIVEQLELVT